MKKILPILLPLLLLSSCATSKEPISFVELGTKRVSYAEFTTNNRGELYFSFETVCQYQVNTFFLISTEENDVKKSDVRSFNIYKDSKLKNRVVNVSNFHNKEYPSAAYEKFDDKLSIGTYFGKISLSSKYKNSKVFLRYDLGLNHVQNYMGQCGCGHDGSIQIDTDSALILHSEYTFDVSVDSYSQSSYCLRDSRFIDSSFNITSEITPTEFMFFIVGDNNHVEKQDFVKANITMNYSYSSSSSNFYKKIYFTFVNNTLTKIENLKVTVKRK